MAIIIPSKNIYDLSNPKVRDNVYNRVEINSQKGVSNNQFDTVVYSSNESFDSTMVDTLVAQGWREEYKHKRYHLSTGGVFSWSSVALGIRGVYIKREFQIPLASENSYISYLKAFSESTAESIGVSFQCKKYVGTGIALVQNDIDTNTGGFILNKQIDYRLPENENYLSRQSFGEVKVEKSSFYESTDHTSVATPLVLELTISGNNDVKIEGRQTQDGFAISVEGILCCYEAFSGGYAARVTNINYIPPDPYEMEINAERYVPILMEISFQGNTIGIDFEKETISIGAQASKNSLSIGSNELIQSTNIYYPPFKHYYDGNYEVIDLGKTYSQRVKVQYIYNGVRGEQYIAAGGRSLRIYNPNQVAFEVVSVTFTTNSISEFYSNILDEYKNGKETATLTCTMSRYLDTNGEAVIDPAVYNVVDLNYFNGDGYSLNIDADNNAIIMRSHGTLDGVQMMTTYDGEPQAEQYADGRTYYKNFFTNKTKVGLRFTLHTTNREEDDYGITLDTSYLPDGNYSLSYELDIKDDVVTILNLQINKGKARPYQKPVRMHFSEGDIVIPMKYTSSGTDVGISLYNNNVNTPKQFKVTGVEIFYDGVTRQKLTLQEV